MKNLSKIIVILFILYAVCSCGVRKSELKKETEVLKTKVDSLSSEIIKLKEKKVVKKNKVVKNDVITKKRVLDLKPVNEKEPIKVVDSEGKETSYFNAIVSDKTEDQHDKTETTKDEETTKEKALEATKNTDLNKEVEKKKEIKEKVTEIKNSWLKFIPFAIFFVLLVLFLLFKNKIPFIKNLFSK